MQKIGVLSHTQKIGDRPQRYVKKSVASLLYRRMLAIWLRKHLIQMKDPSLGGAPIEAATDPQIRRAYEHHIEPRIERLNWENSEWLRYLENY